MDGLILAGGRSRRMEGKHKGSLLYGGREFTRCIADELKRLTDVVWLSYADTVQERYEDCRVVKDIYRGCGPAGGIHAGLCACSGEILAVAACDMPFVKAELYQHLSNHWETQYDGVVPVTRNRKGEEEIWRMHPLAALYGKSMKKVLEEQIEKGNYRMTEILNHAEICYIDVTESKALNEMLKNINTTQEYREIEKQSR